MPKTQYAIYYANEVVLHLKFIEKKYWRIIKETIVEQLQYEPHVETINKKPLSKPPIGDIWELRFGPNNSFRVFYKSNKLKHEVSILAIGLKSKNKLLIANKEIKL